MGYIFRLRALLSSISRFGIKYLGNTQWSDPNKPPSHDAIMVILVRWFQRLNLA